MDQIVRNVLCFDRFALDVARGRLHGPDREIELPPKPFELLRYLVENAGRLVPKDELCRVVWPNVFVSDDSLVQCVRELRERLSDADHRLIRTAPRRGYMLDATVEARADPVIGAPAEGDRADIHSRGDDVAADERNGETRPGAWRRRGGALKWAAGAAALVLAGLGSAAIWTITRPHETAKPATAAVPPAVAPRLSVAVLPFENLGVGADDRHFADGVADDLTAGLSRIFGGQVAARSATSAYKGRPFDIQSAGRALGVRYLVEGSVGRTGDQMRVTARLIDAASRAHLWTEMFASEQRDGAALRDEVAWHLSRRFMIEIYRAESARSIRERPDAPDALDFLIRARALQFRTPRGGDLTEARRMYREATRLDPTMNGAWIGIVYTYIRSVRFSATREQDLAQAEEAAERAVALRPQFASTHVARGWVRYEQGRMEDAFLAFEYALHIDPNYVEGLASLAAAHIMLGRPQQALEPLQRAMRLSPVDFDMPRWRLFLGVAYLHLRRDEEAVAWLKKTAALVPNDPFAQLFLASALALSGRVEEARASVAELLRILPGYTLAKFKAVEPSNAPALLAQRQRVYDGMLRAGLPAD